MTPFIQARARFRGFFFDVFGARRAPAVHAGGDGVVSCLRAYHPHELEELIVVITGQ